MKTIRINNLVSQNDISYPNYSFNQPITAIVGPSGCGKSTLLKLIMGIIIPKTGDVFYDDKNINTLDMINYRHQVMLVNQFFYLEDTTIKGNFEFYYHQKEQTLIDDKQIKSMLNLVNLNFDLNHEIKHLSGGEKQRLFLAICLSFNPEVILLDEVTSSLDEANGDLVMHNVIDYAKEHNMQIIFVSHNKSLVDKYATTTLDLGGK